MLCVGILVYSVGRFLNSAFLEIKIKHRMFSECGHFNELFNELVKSAILMNQSRLEPMNAKTFSMNF